MVSCAGALPAGVAEPGRQPEPTVTLVAVGDILLDRGVARKVERYGIGYPFAYVEDLLTRADIAFGNLEGPLTDTCNEENKRYRFRARERYLHVLKRGGFDVLSLANNHSTDCGQVGLIETMRNLSAAGIRWCGAGISSEDAESATVIERNGIRIGFVGFSEFLPDYSGSASVRARIAEASYESVRSAVEAARRHADVVIASFHWGAEYTSRPREREKKLAQWAIDAGAELVLGHGPHVLQGMQTFTTRSGDVTRRALVAYSLGNFVFDSPGVWDKRMRQTIALRVTLNRFGLVGFEAVPISIEGYRPRPARTTEAKTILTRLDRLSFELDGKIGSMTN